MKPIFNVLHLLHILQGVSVKKLKTFWKRILHLLHLLHAFFFLLFQEKINCHFTFLTLLTPHYQSYLFLSAVYQATTDHVWRTQALLDQKIKTLWSCPVRVDIQIQKISQRYHAKLPGPITFNITWYGAIQL